MYHESHDLKMSMDSSRYDHKCQKCGITDENIDGLRAPCKAATDKPEGLALDLKNVNRINLFGGHVTPPRDAMFSPDAPGIRDSDMPVTNTIPIETGDYDGNTGFPSEEHQYLGLLERILDEGTYKCDRTGVGCYSVRGGMMTFDLTGGKIPLLTTKQMGIRSIVAELLWFLEGSTSAKRLNELGATIWDEWALEDGDLGPIYGKQWVAWEAPNTRRVKHLVKDAIASIQDGNPALARKAISLLKELQGELENPPKVNQIQELVTALKENPNSRRMLVSAWNPAVLPHDYYWEHDQLPATEHPKTLEAGWEVMDTLTRLNWVKEMNWCDNKPVGIDDLDTLEVPNLRRRVKLSPHDNVTMGRAALPACHTFFQVHTREMQVGERLTLLERDFPEESTDEFFEYAISGLDENNPEKDAINEEVIAQLNDIGVPRHALTLQFYCRSQDTPLGTPYNIASYGILAQMLAQCAGMVAEELIWMGGDVHIYSNQLEGVKVQLEREPYPFPTLKLNPEKKDIFGFTIEDFELIDYQHHPKIDFGDIAV